jgi:4a-hydroxytetrahydrobiopterin dehydratase
MHGVVEKPSPLTPDEVAVVLQRLPGWSADDGRLAKDYEFKDFIDSLGFVNRLVPYFEQKDHHPDVHIFYNRIRFELSRYDMGGKITDRDVEVAKLIEHEFARTT